jgi:TRAP transporter 4TM/12TM fusion protein
MTDRHLPRARAVLDTLFYAVSVYFFVHLFYYYWTSLGGPLLLATTLVSVTFILFVLNLLREDDLHPRLSPLANYLIAAFYIVCSAAVAVYMHVENYAIGTERMGAWSGADMFVGGLMTLLVMEYARRRHMPLFVINIILVLYAVYGWMVPGMFYHAGLEWTRIITAMSVEMTTGVWSGLPQLALTVVASFLLVLSVLRGFGCIESLLRATKRVSIRSPHALPQSAVVGSMCVGTVSGSGAANAITIGSATIPAMIGGGMPRATAAAIESASSLGGQLMPPVMGISAFLMAEFLGKSYFDVVARGYVPAIIYYATVAVSVYLLALRHHVRLVNITIQEISVRDWVNLAAFLSVVAGLVGLMAAYHMQPTDAALYVFIVVAAGLALFHVAALAAAGALTWQALIDPVRRFLESFSEMAADLTLLLATLSIMTGALVITGVPTKLGSLLIEAAGVNLAAMVIMAFVFGALLGTGLPPAPTYILVAIVIAPPMIKAGVNPWVVHFFAFFLGVWGELTPPTSIVAAVTAKIADASFYQTLGRALTICVSLFTLMAGVFVRPELVVEPGWQQMQAAALILIATIGITFSLQATFTDSFLPDRLIRLVLFTLALIVLLYPSEQVAFGFCVPVVLMIGYWLARRRTVLEAEMPDAPAQAALAGAPPVLDSERGRMS